VTVAAAGLLRTVATVFATLAVGLPGIWGGFALDYQFPGGQVAKGLAVALWAAFCVSLLLALWQGRVALGLTAFALAFAVLLIWWTRLAPTNDREWADEVAQISHGTVAGNRVTLYNVRNFDWHTPTDYTQRWETRTYDLDRLRSVDMIMSYWSGPAIAHMLISFGFEAGVQVVFSVEIRRQKTQAYSSLGGFFKEFELSIVAADELDVIRVRTNVRGEDVYLYRLQLPQEAMRRLFLAYVAEADALLTTPRFYNTITVNCTTLVYHMMKRIVGRLPVDYRLLFSGYLPDYVYGVGGLDRAYPLAELRARGRITLRAQESERGARSGVHSGAPIGVLGSVPGGVSGSERFSADIRRGIPGLD
jgi:hypothetical protein